MAGFGVVVEVTPGEVIVFAEDLVHVHFGGEDAANATAAEALQCVRTLLSPDARLTMRTPTAALTARRSRSARLSGGGPPR
jgi:hypothetical protein